MVAAFATVGVHASEQVAESMPVPEVVAPIMVYDLAPAVPSVRIQKGDRRVAELRPTDKPKLAKKPVANKSMLSRTARSQMALLAARLQPANAISLNFFNDQDGDVGADELDLHRFFSRPRVVEFDDQDDADDNAISDDVKLRLFLARMKAVEAHRMASMANQPDSGEAGLSDAVKLRLSLARMKAIQAHRKLFS
ncbi:MAG: hypothetical protein WAV95_03065 [Azonexus sp.]